MSGNGQEEIPEERGRYLAVRTGVHSMVIYRAVNLCERCSECGCGDQQEPIDLSPGGIAKMVAMSGMNIGDVVSGMNVGEVVGGARRARKAAKAGKNGG